MVMILSKDQCNGRGVRLFHPLLGTFFFSDSVSLARVTPLFLTTTGFRIRAVGLSNILDTNTERDG